MILIVRPLRGPPLDIGGGGGAVSGGFAWPCFFISQMTREMDSFIFYTSG